MSIDPRSSPKHTPHPDIRRPSSAALEHRIERAERQRDFALEAGWPDVAECYQRLADGLRAMLSEPER